MLRNAATIARVFKVVMFIFPERNAYSPDRAIKIHRRRFFDPDHRLVPIFVSGPAAFSYVRLLSSSGSLAIFAAIRRALPHA